MSAFACSALVAIAWPPMSTVVTATGAVNAGAPQPAVDRETRRAQRSRLRCRHGDDGERDGDRQQWDPVVRLAAQLCGAGALGARGAWPAVRIHRARPQQG